MSLERKILIVNGSPRKKGNSDFLQERLEQAFEGRGVSFEAVYLRDLSYSSCIGCERCRKDEACTGLKDDLTDLYSQILSCQGLVLISPAHNYNVTAWMKAFIDRMYCFYHFENDRPRSWTSRLAGEERKALVVGICEQIHKEDMGFTIGAMERPLEALGYDIVETIPVYGVFDRGAVKDDKGVLDEIGRAGDKLARTLKSSNNGEREIFF
ncbi:MAG: flavodoxin family protein [Spirochaetales bacterium]|nr:flavodoxin family protein [Spirochaetales bacterium]